MKVVLTRKLADSMDGIDVAGRHVGDVLDLTAAEAELLLAEHWATLERRRERGETPAVERRRTNVPPDGGDVAKNLERAS